MNAHSHWLVIESGRLNVNAASGLRYSKEHLRFSIQRNDRQTKRLTKEAQRGSLSANRDKDNSKDRRPAALYQKTSNFSTVSRITVRRVLFLSPQYPPQRFQNLPLNYFRIYRRPPRPQPKLKAWRRGCVHWRWDSELSGKPLISQTAPSTWGWFRAQVRGAGGFVG